MGRAIIGLVALVVGLVIGALFGGALTGGAAVGIGVATGLGAGICSTVKAAEAEGLLTAEQIDQVLNRAAADMASLTGDKKPEDVVGSTADCDAVMAKLKAAQSG